MTGKQRDALMRSLQERFEKHMTRHPGLAWAKVQARLERHPDKLRALHEMEASGGEPDVVACDKKTGACTFVDCSPESPAGRRSLCYDEDALRSRKEHKPSGSALGAAKTMGIEILSEEAYRALQQLGEFDLKTSSWIQTPAEIRKRGGALFCDRRYGAVFLYHNGAESYYASRGFRGSLTI